MKTDTKRIEQKIKKQNQSERLWEGRYDYKNNGIIILKTIR